MGADGNNVDDDDTGGSGTDGNNDIDSNNDNDDGGDKNDSCSRDNWIIAVVRYIVMTMTMMMMRMMMMMAMEMRMTMATINLPDQKVLELVGLVNRQSATKL